jgi:geranylgeranyl diphosphate synthase, type II
MHSIAELQSVVKRTFEEESFSFTPASLYDPISYTLGAGGKRIRPLLVLVGCDIFNGNLDHARPALLATELFHNFTLLHDDIMDLAPLRRGRETVHKKWNTNAAILAGDTMFAMACQYLSSVPWEILPEALSLFTLTARQVCEGQQYDMDFESRKEVSIAEYLQMIRLKTAVLLGCSLKLGALVARAPEAEAEKLRAFGEAIGTAFQIQDDLLDAFGDEKKFGKETGGDILAGKKTYLLLKAYELAGEKEKTELDACFSDRSLPPGEKIARVKKVYKTLEVHEFTGKAIENEFSNAMRWCESLNTEDAGKKLLGEFAHELLKRDF